MFYLPSQDIAKDTPLLSHLHDAIDHNSSSSQPLSGTEIIHVFRNALLIFFGFEDTLTSLILVVRRRDKESRPYQTVADRLQREILKIM